MKHPIDAPDWNLVPFEVGCARCGHDLRGQTEPRCPACGLEFEWSEAVPIEKLVCRKCNYQLLGLSAARCPECGQDFTWEQALDDYHRSRKPIFEFRWRSEPIRSLIRTWGLALQPRKLWRIIDLHDPPKTWPLLVMTMVGVLALVLVRALPQLTLELIDYWRFIDASRKRGVPDSQLAQWWWEFARSIPGYFAPNVANAIAGIWAVLSLGSLMIFQQSMRLCRVRFSHVLRVWVFAVVLLAPLLALGSLPAWLLQRQFGMPALNRILSDGTVPNLLLLTVLVSAYAQVQAYRRYLKMPHSLGVIVAAQMIALLATLLVISLGVVFG